MKNVQNKQEYFIKESIFLVRTFSEYTRNEIISAYFDDIDFLVDNNIYETRADVLDFILFFRKFYKEYYIFMI